MKVTKYVTLQKQRPMKRFNAEREFKGQKIDYLNNQQLRLHPALFTLDFYDATK